MRHKSFMAKHNRFRTLKVAGYAALAMATIGLATPAGAQDATPVTTITMLRTGWNLDQFAVVTAASIINSANCPTPDGYISAQSLPGHQTYYAAALKALGGVDNIVVIVDNSNCFHGRPKLVGINYIP